MRTTAFVLSALIATLITVHAQQAPARGGRGGGQPVGAIRMLKPNLYVVPGAGANSIVRVTNEGVILVDTKLPGEANYNGLVEQIKTVTPQPVKTVIVTHHHDSRSDAAGAVKYKAIITPLKVLRKIILFFAMCLHKLTGVNKRKYLVNHIE